MIELRIQRCERCGTNAFPDRLWCLGCGATELRHVPAGPGGVEEATTLRRPAAGAADGDPVRLGTVRLESGPLVIVRLPAEVGAGTQVRLDRTPAGVIWARATPG